MNLNDSGSLIRGLRKAKGITQKDIADILGIQPKTVSKWETGNGFPDVSYISELADILGVSERILLSGNLKRNAAESGNMKKNKLFRLSALQKHIAMQRKSAGCMLRKAAFSAFCVCGGQCAYAGHFRNG